MKPLIVAIICILSLNGFVSGSCALSIGLGTEITKNVKPLKAIREENIVRQTYDYSCGPASMATLLTYYFMDKVSEEDVIGFLLYYTSLEKIKANKGFSLLDLKHFAMYKGYNVTGYKADISFLIKLSLPALVPISVRDYSHFVIFRGVSGDRVFITDPALGNMTMKIDKFQKIWQSGICLVMSKPWLVHKISPLDITNDDQAVFCDPATIRSLLGTQSLGKILSDGEF